MQRKGKERKDEHEEVSPDDNEEVCTLALRQRTRCAATKHNQQA
jgi:hypothetical protein